MGGRHGRNQSAGAIPFFASAFASMSPRTSKPASTSATPTTAASPATASPATRRTPPSAVTSLAASDAVGTPTVVPTSPPPPNSRDVLDALRLLCSGRVFRSYTAPPPPLSSDESTAPLQCDWYLFFDIEDSPFDSIRGRGQSSPIPSTKRNTADEQKQPSPFQRTTDSSGVIDQRGMLFYNVVGAGQPQKQKLVQQCIALSSITSVLLGKQSALLLHPSLARVREDCCFSLALADGSQLCFSSKSPIMLVSFLMALKRLMAANCMDEDVLSVRAVIRRGLIDGVLTAALTPSNSQLHPAESSSTSQPSSPRASAGGLLLPPTAQSRLGRVSPTHVRSRSQNTAVLFKQLADVSYPPANAPIRSLSPLPVDSRTISPRRPSSVKAAGADSNNYPASSVPSTSSTSSTSPAASSITPPSPAALSPVTHLTSLTLSTSSPPVSAAATWSAPATPHHKPPPLSTLLSPGDPTTKFTLLGRLGQGRSGIVHKALYRPLSTHVAIKILTLSPTQPQSSELIAAEVDLLSRSACDYMVGYVGCWRKGQEVWVVQEYMVGGSLSDFMLISAHTLLELEVCAVMHHTLLALQLFHSQQRIHRDVKASNILLNAAGQAKLSDVGTAIQLSPHHIAHTSIGSPYWMAPEVLSSDNVNRSYDEKADIWSLGITALELAYGDPPHHTLSVHQVMRTIVDSEPPRLESAKGVSASRWSDEFAEFVAMCLQKDPSKRPTAGQLLQSRFIRRMELEEACEVLSAMWRAWGERIEAYRAMEVEIEQKQQAQLDSDVKRAKQQRRQEVAAQLSGFDMDGVGVCRMGPSDWHASDVEYSQSSSQPRYMSHHSRSISPSSSSSGNHRLHSQSGDREPLSPSLSSRRTGVAGGANSAMSDRGGGAGGISISSSGVAGKMVRSMSFSASFTQYGVRDADGEEDGGLEMRKEENDEEDEQLTVIDYSNTTTPSHANRTPRKQRPPVPPFPRLSSTSSPSPPSKPPSSATSLPSPTQSSLARASSFPTAPGRRSRARLDSYDVDEDDAVERSESGSSVSASRSSRGGDSGRRDILYTAEFSSRTSRYGGGAEDENEGEAEGDEFSRQFVEEDESGPVASGMDDAMTAEEAEELEEAYRAVINYSQ